MSTPTRNLVVPGNWASVKGGKWHLIPGNEMPTWQATTTSKCGIRFEPLNVTGGEAPPTNDYWICSKCTK
jgi:hypothetical protein